MKLMINLLLLRIRAPLPLGKIFDIWKRPSSRFYAAPFSGETHLIVDSFELPFPGVIVKKRSVIVAIVVGAVSLSVTRRRKHSHFVTVYRVAAIEMFHLVCDLWTNESFKTTRNSSSAIHKKKLIENN